MFAITPNKRTFAAGPGEAGDTEWPGPSRGCLWQTLFAGGPPNLGPPADRERAGDGVPLETEVVVVVAVAGVADRPTGDREPWAMSLEPASIRVRFIVAG